MAGEERVCGRRNRRLPARCRMVRDALRNIACGVDRPLKRPRCQRQACPRLFRQIQVSIVRAAGSFLSSPILFDSRTTRNNGNSGRKNERWSSRERMQTGCLRSIPLPQGSRPHSRTRCLRSTHWMKMNSWSSPMTVFWESPENPAIEAGHGCGDFSGIFRTAQRRKSWSRCLSSDNLPKRDIYA